MPLRVGDRSHLTLCIPCPSTIWMRSARLFSTTTSRTCPVSVTLTLIFSSVMQPPWQRGEMAGQPCRLPPFRPFRPFHLAFHLGDVVLRLDQRFRLPAEAGTVHVMLHAGLAGLCQAED